MATETIMRELVLRAEALRCAALAGPDLEALDALFAADFIHIHSNGLLHNKAALLAHIANRGSGVTVERGPLDVRIYGDVAIVVGAITNFFPSREGPPRKLSGIATQVLRLESASWRFVSSQFTESGN